MNDKRQGFKKIEMLWSRVRPPFLHMGRNILDDLLTWTNMHQEAIYLAIQTCGDPQQYCSSYNGVTM